MVVETPEFDKDLTGHAAIELENDPGVVHAKVSDLHNGEMKTMTECGHIVDEFKGKSRGEYVEEGGYDFCEDCWPPLIVE